MLPVPVSLPAASDEMYVNETDGLVYVTRVVLVGENASSSSTTVTLSHKPTGDAVPVTGDMEVTSKTVELEFGTSLPLKVGEKLLGEITGSEACEGYLIVEKVNKLGR